MFSWNNGKEMMEGNVERGLAVPDCGGDEGRHPQSGSTQSQGRVLQFMFAFCGVCWLL